MDIWEAAREGDLQRVRALAERHGRSVHDETALGLTALFGAARGGHIGVARYLLDAGADIDHRDLNGWTALHNASSCGNTAVVSLLVQRGADVTAVTFTGSTVLSLAAHHGRDAIVRELLQQSGSDVDAITNYGQTALHLTCSEGHVGVLRQLLEAGADPTLRDSEGRTAVDRATYSGHGGCVRVIQNWDQAYMLQRARRIRDAASPLPKGVAAT